MIDPLLAFFMVILAIVIVGGTFCLIEGVVKAVVWLFEHKPPHSAMRDWRDSSRCLAAYHQRRAEANR